MHGGGPAVVPGSPASSPGFDSNPLYLTGIKPGYVRLKRGTICFLRPKNETTISYTVTKQLTSIGKNCWWYSNCFGAGAPLKAEYTEENLPLVEAGFCNLRKQVCRAMRVGWRPDSATSGYRSVELWEWDGGRILQPQETGHKSYEGGM